jgi:hypothetical protein
MSWGGAKTTSDSDVLRELQETREDQDKQLKYITKILMAMLFQQEQQTKALELMLENKNNVQKTG